MALHQIGIIGLGKIAQDQHLPVIKANPDFQLLAVSSQRGLTHEDARYTFLDYRDLLKLPDIEAVSICTPPQVRHQIARDALVAGKGVLLEKPPAATLSELEDLRRRSARSCSRPGMPSTTRPSTRPRRLSPAGRSSGFS
jgi:D-galactose 1-dehydrogenase